MQIRFFTLLFLITCVLQVQGQTVIIYADASRPNNSGDGLSWATAKRDFQNAIDAAYVASGTLKQVWVKKGTYQPQPGAIFTMMPNVAMYGGFAGTETLLSQRNYINNTTILSGNGNRVIYCSGPSFTATTILDGFTVTNGTKGGITIDDGGTCVVANCNVIYNSNPSGTGGGISMHLNSSPTIKNCFIMNNTASTDGGGMQIESSCNPTLINCVFTGNVASNGWGGGINSNSSAATVINCTFYANTAPKVGVGNGGAIESQSPSNITIYNSIIWGNNASSNPNLGGTFTVSYSLIQGGYAGTGNINADPFFTNINSPAGPDGIPSTTDDGLKLSNCSPAQNVGKNGLVPSGITTDIAGSVRVQNTIVDLGAYEGGSGIGNKTVYVDVARADNTGDGFSWATAKKDIQAGINLAFADACANRQVWVKAGTYNPTDYPTTGLTNGRDKTIYVKDGILLYGGFAGTEATFNQRNTSTNTTTLSGDIGALNDSTDNCYHVVIVGSNAIIDGFTIKRATANGLGNVNVNGNILERNKGGGVRTMGNNDLVSSNYIFSNYAADGAGIYLKGTSHKIQSNFIGNNNGDYGVGTLAFQGSSTIVNNVYYKNNASTEGGGLYIYQGANTAVVNNTFYGNNTNVNGGGIFIYNSSSVNITNNIFWKNTKSGNANTLSADTYNASSSTFEFRNNLLQLDAINYSYDYTTFGIGEFAGGNIFAQDPLFYDEANIDGNDNFLMTTDDGLKLKGCSPSLNTGNNAYVPAFVSTDITGVARVQASTVDMGAYEGNATFGNKTVFVDALRPDNSGDGFSWATAKKDLQNGIDLSFAYACASKEVWVRQGTYQPVNGNIYFTMQPGVSIYGGFNGNESSITQRNWKTNTTTLSGVGNMVVNFSGNSIMASTVLSGFTITNGYYSGIQMAGNCSPTIENCRFTANNATLGSGGAIRINNCSPVINNCIFDNNTAYQDGGAIDIRNNCNPVITNCVFTGNVATTGWGGGINCITSVNAIISNATFFANAAPKTNIGRGGGLAAYDASTPILNNCIVWGNTAGTANTNFYGPFSVTNSLAEGGYAGIGNLNANPNFVNTADPRGPDGLFATADDGLRLSTCSPAINNGNNSLLPTGTTTDITGSNRVQFTNVDMGAYENTVASANTGGLPIVSITCIATQSSITSYYDICNGLLATINSNGASPIAGITTAKVWIETTQPVQYVKRHYEITPAANAATATGRITLYFTQAEFNAFNNQIPAPALLLPTSPTDAAGIANIRVEKRPGTSSDGTGLPNTYSGTPVTIDPDDNSIMWNAPASRWEINFDVSGFSGFFVKTQASVLPLQWLSFNAQLNNSSRAQLQWQVIEKSITRYEIEKSIDAGSFSKIGQLNSKGDGSNVYLFTEQTSLDGTAFYRIKQNGRDGSTSYSTVVKLSNRTRATQVTPTIFNTGFLVTTYTAQTAILADMSGRLIKTFTLNAGYNHISAENLPAGMYIIKTSQGEAIRIEKQ